MSTENSQKRSNVLLSTLFDNSSIFIISKSINSKAFIKELDPARVRPTDITLQIPDSSKLLQYFIDHKLKNLMTNINDF